MTKVKICGLSTAETVAACLKAKANFIGFVAYPKSPRHVSAHQFSDLAKSAGDIPTVLVTVNATDEFLDEYLGLHIPTYVQCHGGESVQRLKEIRAKGTKIIKALPIAEAADLEHIAQYRDHADILLLDAKPIAGELPGGNAKSFDWSLLANASIAGDWMLSGGLNPDNVTSATSQTNAPMLDVSSGVETSFGVKDSALIESFMNHATR